MRRVPSLARDLVSIAVYVAIMSGAFFVLEKAPIPGLAYYRRIIVMMGINIILAVSLNIINGHAGQFSLGHAGFMALGAYVAAFLTVFYFSPWLETMPEGST